MASFQILIDEEQRQALILVLQSSTLTDRLPALEGWVRMLADLKDDDNNYWVDPLDGKRKHITHGFCL